jgi:hypothetical protein
MTIVALIKLVVGKHVADNTCIIPVLWRISFWKREQEKSKFIVFTHFYDITFSSRILIKA